MVASLFFVTSLIVLPFLPDAFVATPILSICKEYMPGVMTAIYWLVVMLSVISTGPTFIFNTSNRFVKVWKTEKVPQRVKLFVIALAFLFALPGTFQDWSDRNLPEGLHRIGQRGNLRYRGAFVRLHYPCSQKG